MAETTAAWPESIPEICETARFGSPGAGRTAPELLIEIPHGATRAADFHAMRRRLAGDYPADLEQYFHVNTDVGAPECAMRIAELVAVPRACSGRAVLVTRSLVPRTFIDCNRAAGGGEAAELRRARFTPALPDYVRHPGDVELLTSAWRRYTEQAERAFELVCGAGGLALILHTYAPRAVEIHDAGDGIVQALQAAYEPETYRRWKQRPEVDLITEATDRARLAPEPLVCLVRQRLEAAGFQVGASESYRMHPATMGYRHAARWPGHVLCVELRRDLLADPFVPFESKHVAPPKVERLAAPLAAAISDELQARGR